jgi:hypothetical protein
MVAADYSLLPSSFSFRIPGGNGLLAFEAERFGLQKTG